MKANGIHQNGLVVAGIEYIIEMFKIIIGNKQRCAKRFPPITELIGMMVIQNEVYRAHANSPMGHVWNENAVQWELRWTKDV